MSDPHQPLFPLPPTHGAGAPEPYRYPVIGQHPQPRKPPRPPMPKPSRAVVIVGVVVLLVLVTAIAALVAVPRLVKSDEEKAAEAINALTVLATIPVGQGPHGVVLDEGAQMAYVANLHDDSVSVIDTASLSPVAVIPGVDAPRNLALDATAGRLFATGGSGGVTVIDTATRTVAQVIPTGSGEWVAVDPERGRLWVVGGTNDVYSVQTFDAVTGDPLHTVPLPTFPGGLAVDADSGVAYVSMGLNDDVALWLLDAETAEVTHRMTLPHAGDIALNGAGTVATAEFEEVYFIDPDYSVSPMELQHRLFNIEYDRGTGLLYGTSAYENLVAVLDPATASVVKTIAMDNPEDVAIDSERHLVYVTNNKSGTLTVVGAASD